MSASDYRIKGYFKIRLKITGLDLAVIFYNLFSAYDDPTVGFEDANQTIFEVASAFNRVQLVDRNKIESVLWACNLMSEKGKFWHPQGLSFDAWINKLKLIDKFNKKYNFLTDKEDER